ncbi:hypothetical protein B0H14DRAFT_3149035, partial [Mycena olivaceomarginata]
MSHRSLTDEDPKHEEKHLKRSLPPVVFALPRSASGVAGDAGRRVVEFYMSWRGRRKPTPSTAARAAPGSWREALDGEWKRASRAINGAVCGDGGEMDDVRAVTLEKRAMRVWSTSSAWGRVRGGRDNDASAGGEGAAVRARVCARLSDGCGETRRLVDGGGIDRRSGWTLVASTDADGGGAGAGDVCAAFASAVGGARRCSVNEIQPGETQLDGYGPCAMTRQASETKTRRCTPKIASGRGGCLNGAADAMHSSARGVLPSVRERNGGGQD